MADSLRDQLLKSGIVKQLPKERPRPSPGGKSSGKSPARPVIAASARSPREEMDLAKAYAIRAQTEASERQRAERAVAEQARLRKERKLKIQHLLEGQALNRQEADQVRHFEYGGKIRRIHVDPVQLTSLNGGDLGVVQQAGRYLLVSREIAEQVHAIDPQQLALLVDPAAAGASDDGVPDDLMW
jgi:uncharacterized protein YaiL (DUF2058 family)